MRHTALWFVKSQINDFFRYRLNWPQLEICRRLIGELFHKRGLQQQNFCHQICCWFVELLVYEMYWNMSEW